MMRFVTLFQWATYVFVALLQSSCMTTQVPLPRPLPAAQRLAALAPQELPIFLCPNETFRPEAALGYQYLLLALPYGSVTLQDHPNRAIAHELLLEFAIRNIRVREVATAEQSRFEICLTELSLNAYDLLFTRLVRSRIEAQLTIRSKGGEVVGSRTIQGSSSRLRQFGFASELKESLHEALKELVKESLNYG